MKKVQTKLMSKLFSDSTPNEFKDAILNKFDEAKETGASSYSDEDEDLEFNLAEDGSVDIIDNVNNETTNAKLNPDDPSDINLTASETQPDVVVPRAKGIDGEHIENSVPTVVVDIDPSITDEGKAGIKNFSLKFYGNISFSNIYKANKAVLRAFSECPIEATKGSLQKAADDALANTKPTNEDKQFAEVEDKLSLIADNASEIAKAVDDMEDNPELAKSVKEMCDKLMSDINEFESDNEGIADLKEVKSQCKKFADKADEVISNNEPTQAPTEAPTNAPTEAPTEAATEAATEEPTESPTKSAEELKKDNELTSTAEELKEKANELAKAVEDMGDDETKAESVKKMSDELDKKADEAKEAFGDDIDVEDIKANCKKFSESAEKIIGKNVRSFSQSPYMRVGNIETPVIKPASEQKIFSNSNKNNEKRQSLNPYLFKTNN